MLCSYPHSGKIPSDNLTNQMLARCQCHCILRLVLRRGKKKYDKVSNDEDGLERPEPDQHHQPPISLSVPSHTTFSRSAANQISHRSQWLSVTIFESMCTNMNMWAGRKEQVPQWDLVRSTYCWECKHTVVFHTTTSSFYPNSETRRHFFLHIYTERNMHRPWALLLEGIGVTHFGQSSKSSST